MSWGEWLGMILIDWLMKLQIVGNFERGGEIDRKGNG